MPGMQQPERTTITPDEAARAYGVGRDTVYEHAEDLGGFRAGRRVIFPLAVVAQKLGLTPQQLLALVTDEKSPEDETPDGGAL